MIKKLFKVATGGKQSVGVTEPSEKYKDCKEAEVKTEEKSVKPSDNISKTKISKKKSSRNVFRDEHELHKGLTDFLQIVSNKVKGPSGKTELTLIETEYLISEVQHLLITHDEIQVKAEEKLKESLLTTDSPEVSAFLTDYFSDAALSNAVAKVSRKMVRTSLSRTLIQDETGTSEPKKPVKRIRRQSIVNQFVQISNAVAVDKQLENLIEWDFDIFAAHELLGENTMQLIGYALFAEHCSRSIEGSQLKMFLSEIERGYDKSNRYHNSLHAADVMQTLCHFTVKCGINEITSDTLKFAGLLAAVCHDVGHPGVSNQFLSATASDLAITYNDKSPLENFHSAYAFRIMQKDESNVLFNFEPEEAIGIRRAMIEMILATDNAKHTKYLNMLENKLKTGTMFTESSSSDDQLLLLRIALHAADVSNPAKPYKLYKRWTDRIVTEFYLQGDRERSLGLPVSPINDRVNPIPEDKFQIGFISAIVLPLFKCFERVPGIHISHCVKRLETNLSRWKGDLEFDDEADDVKSQENHLLSLEDGSSNPMKVIDEKSKTVDIETKNEA